MDDLAGLVLPAECVVGRPLIVKTTTGSTNDDAKRLAVEGCAQGTVVLADVQTAGRGRLGRTWFSPPATNLYFSVVWRDGLRAASLGSFALATGLAVAPALDAFVPTPMRIKWPNDVRSGGRKVAGVLAEAIFRGDRPYALVLGVGVNVRQVDFPSEFAERATSLRNLRGADLRRSDVLRALLRELESTLDLLAHRGFDALHPGVVARCETLGTTVRVGGVEGLAMGIDGGGGLLVRSGDGTMHTVTSGEVA